MIRKERADHILARLIREYPNPECALLHKNAFQLVAATILSAQCTDERVNMVTPVLFKRFSSPRRMAAAELEELMEIIHSTGFYRNKSKSLKGMAIRVTEEYGGKVPDTMEDLLTLPGVARKTANVVLGTWFGKNEGVVVDTHVSRLTNRMGLTRQKDPQKIEKDLIKIIPREEWTNLSHRLISHGRGVCDARAPQCDGCVIGADLCPSYEPDLARWRKKGKKKMAKKKAAKKKVAKTLVAKKRVAKR